jgi:hypothetical protein
LEGDLTRGPRSCRTHPDHAGTGRRIRLDSGTRPGQDHVVSIVESLKKLVDPVRARQEESERRTARERPDADDKGGPPPPTRRCRVCGHEGPEPIFCPDCLAETMRPL